MKWANDFACPENDSLRNAHLGHLSMADRHMTKEINSNGMKSGVCVLLSANWKKKMKQRSNGIN
jgi:hypothetical protein